MPLTADALAICNMVRSEIVRTGWTETARRSGIDRTALHRAFREGAKPRVSFAAVMAVAEVVGLEFTVRRRA